MFKLLAIIERLCLFKTRLQREKANINFTIS